MVVRVTERERETCEQNISLIYIFANFLVLPKNVWVLMNKTRASFVVVFTEI